MIRKFTAILLAVLALGVAFSNSPLSAQAENTVTVIVDGRTVDFPDAPAYIDENGRTQLPARYIGEALGAHVGWDEATGKVTISRRSLLWGEALVSSLFIDFNIDSEFYYTYKGRNGKNTGTRGTMDTKAVIEQNRTYIPVRYVAEALDAKVDWDESIKTVTITSETKAIGEYVIPKSYTEEVKKFEYEDDHGVRRRITQFYLDKSEYLMGVTSFTNRMQIAFYLLSQKLSQDTINELNELTIGGRIFLHEDDNRYKYEIILDSRSGQYIELINHGSTYWLNIYDKGYTP